MELQKAKREQSKIKIAIAGASGSGKTYSALQLAYGLCGQWDKIAVIDTENYSASLYAHLGDFNVINIKEPFHPEKYVQAIKMCEHAGIEVIIIDSISHEWNGKGGCLDLHEKETAKMRIPNSFTAWASITPIHQAFLDAIIQSPLHIISCVRSKTDYVLTERNGRQVPQKVGMAPITRDGFDFEVSIAFDLDQQHKAFCSKDRTGLFTDKPSFVISPKTGELINSWCNSIPTLCVDDVAVRIGECKSLNELLSLYSTYPQFKKALENDYEGKKRQLIINNDDKQKFQPSKLQPNGQSVS